MPDVQCSSIRRAAGAKDTIDGDLADAYLLQRVQEGYVGACDVFLRRHPGLAYPVALPILGNHYDVQDVAQDSPTSPWQNLSRFRGASSLTTWLYRIVTLKALNRPTRSFSTG